MLENKTAVVYGGAGSVGGATAKAFAREGARVVLAGRTRATLETVAADIAAAGGAAEVAEVDALDEQAVGRHADAVAEQAGRLDISFNAVGMDNGDQGAPLLELSADDYLRPVTEYVRTQFVTATAAARHMTAQGSGVILPLSNPMGRMPAALTGPFGQACAAVENLSRQLAAELGPAGVRVVCLRPTGMPDTARRASSTTAQVWGRAAQRLGISLEQLLEMVSQGNLLERPLEVEEVAEVAAFLASDRASGMTATVANVSCGSVVD